MKQEIQRKSRQNGAIYISECRGVGEPRRFTFGRPSIQTNRSQRRSPDTSEWKVEPAMVHVVIKTIVDV